MMQLLVMVLLFGSCVPVVSEENIGLPNQIEICDELSVLVHIGYGNEHLLSHQYQAALDDFQKASSLIEQLNQEWAELKFLIYFGKTIAYDNLKMHDECKQSLGALFFLMYVSEEEDSQEIHPDPSINDSKAAIFFMSELAILSSSQQIRETLLHIVDEMSTELLPVFHLADPLSTENLWDFDHSNEKDSLELSKSFWKRMKKMLKKLPDILHWIADVLEASKRIDHATK